MIINWFPGHMNKALKMMSNEIEIVDAVIYVLDARAPFSCLNPKFDRIIGNKPVIFVLNKTDLANGDTTKEWLNYFDKPNSKCIALSSTLSGAASKIEQYIRELNKIKIDKYKAKNLNIPMRAMVIGVPNSGKSTLINNLCGVAKTKTGNIAGVTRGKQWVRIVSGIELLDMPGTLWPSFNNNRVARTLAYLGSIRDEVLDIPELSLALIEDLNNIDVGILQNRYNIIISEDDTPLLVLEKICQSRKYLLKGGEFDYDRTSSAIVNDFRSGRLGCISMEKPKDIKLLLKVDKVKADNE